MPDNAVDEPTVEYTWRVGGGKRPDLTLADPHTGRALTIEPWLIKIAAGYWGERLAVTISGDTIKQNGERGKHRRAHSFYSDANPEWHHGFDALPTWAFPYVQHVRDRQKRGAA